MTDHRPNPDQLLAAVQQDEARARRGKLKIFFGAAPGVGKTYAMLEAARKVGKEGIDVVVGYLEPHIRPETQALVLGLDVLQRRTIDYRGTRLVDFDLDAALTRKPQVLLVDELAHSNAPGMQHQRRFQDVERLLEAGIDVYTTLNVQHLESLNDVVAQITGVRVRETVPDNFFEQADEVELVDISPDDLLDRLREGKVYVPGQAERAIEHFFQKGNLLALRELALRQTAQRVDAQMSDYRQLNAVRASWPVAERLLVCVGPSPMSAKLIRAARRLSAEWRAPWIALHVESPRDARLSSADLARLADHLRLAEELGAETAVVTGHNVPDEVLAFARQRNVTKIVVGKPRLSRWTEFWRGSLVSELIRRCKDIDVFVTQGEEASPTPRASSATRKQYAIIGYLGSVAVVFGCTLIATAFDAFHASVANMVMIYLLGVIVVSLCWGRGPSIVASFMGVLAFDFFFIPPRLQFAVEDTQYIFTFAVMLLTGLIVANLVSLLRFQADAARQRERKSAALFEVSRHLSDAHTSADVAAIAVENVTAAMDATACVLVPNDKQDVAVAAGFLPEEHDLSIARWVLMNGQPAGRGSESLPGSRCLMSPIPSSNMTVGVLGILFRDEKHLATVEQRSLVDTIARLTGMALERIRLGQQTEQRRVEVETERLRNSLLSAVSHDLRTPLAALAGASSTLLASHGELSEETRRELTTSIFEETTRLNRLVANLLDMTRLEGGGLALHQEWQTLEELIGIVLRRLQSTSAKTNIGLHLDPDLPLLWIDETLMQQVLMNLLENALKHAGPKTPIEILAKRTDNMVTVSIADSGPGIPAGDENRIFEKFYRSQGSSRSGAGLGLAICKGIVNLHGGVIWAENRPSGGAVFRFTLPVLPPPPIHEAATAELGTATT